MPLGLALQVIVPAIAPEIAAARAALDARLPSQTATLPL
jgi:hypothetical protein